jgi:hypothetical protein
VARACGPEHGLQCRQWIVYFIGYKSAGKPEGVSPSAEWQFQASRAPKSVHDAQAFKIRKNATVKVTELARAGALDGNAQHTTIVDNAGTILPDQPCMLQLPLGPITRRYRPPIR